MLLKFNMAVNVRIRNTEERSRNHYCREKQKYYVFCLSVCNLLNQTSKAHAPYYILICGLSGSAMFFHITS
jgi:hypothetical protein